MQRLHHLLSHFDRYPQPSHQNPVHGHNQKIGYLGAHDLGGNKDFLDQSLHRDVSSLTYWERKIDAFMGCLLSQGLFTVSEMRQNIELIPKKSYLTIAYYEKWFYSALRLLLNKGILAERELIAAYRKHPAIQTLQSASENRKYEIGDRVQVRNVCDARITYENWRLYLGLNETSHVRTPGYIIGKVGVIQSYLGMLPNDELVAFGITDARVPVYKVEFKQKDLFPESKANEQDSVEVEIISHWLQVAASEEEHEHEHQEAEEEHVHDKHEQRETVECNAIRKEPQISPYELLSEVVIALCCEKGIVSVDRIRQIMEQRDMAKQANLAPKIVLKAWRDPEWKRKLMIASEQGRGYAFIGETFGMEHLMNRSGTILKIVENDANTHNVVCCTLCSCYPRPLLGLPPHWYKSSRYRSEIVSKPRELLRTEFGCDIPKEMVLRVHDSTSDMRYIVLPHPSQIPNYANMSDEQLEHIITRDMVIGVKR